jgi:hypothetical protein
VEQFAHFVGVLCVARQIDEVIMLRAVSIAADLLESVEQANIPSGHY